VVAHTETFQNAFRNTLRATTPSAPHRWLRNIFLLAQPPLLKEEWSTTSPQHLRKTPAYFTTAVRTCEGSAESVQATTMSLPEATILGNPPEAAATVPETFITAPAVPFAATRRM